MEHFYIQDITLSNYRKFEQSTFQLNPSMNVLVGKNAAGKTTILEAVNVMLGAYLAAYKKYVPSRFVCNISENDILLKVNKKMRKVYCLQLQSLNIRVRCHLIWCGIKISLNIPEWSKKRVEGQSFPEKIPCKSM